MKYSELAMKVARGETLDSYQLSEYQQYLTNDDTNRDLVNSWQQEDKRISSEFINFPIVLIGSQKITTSTPSVTFQVPIGYNHILIMGSGRTDVVAAGTEIVMQINGDTGSNYGTTSDGVDNDVFAKNQTNSTTYMVIGLFPGTLATTSASGMLFSYIFHVNSTDYWKSVISTRGLFSGNMAFLGGFGQWKSTDRISSLTIGTSGNFLTGTVLTILGIK